MSEVQLGDIWKQWLLHRRDVTDEQRAIAQDRFKELRDKVLDKAELVETNVLLDVGTGTGLIAFGALERIGENGRVIFSDISSDCLDHCRSLVEELGLLDRTQFIEAAVEDLSAIPDESVDIVTSRSVLIYTQDKRRAFDEFHRVLKPGGRVSMFEPINSFRVVRRDGWFRGYDVRPIAEIAMKVDAAIEAHQPTTGSTMLGFDERDMMHWAYDAGFKIVTIELTAGIYTCRRSGQWESLYRSAPNPLALSLEEAVAKALDENDAARFVEFMQDAVENQDVEVRGARMFLVAQKAGA